jgi:hypothetical protein
VLKLLEVTPKSTPQSNFSHSGVKKVIVALREDTVKGFSEKTDPDRDMNWR